MSGGEVKRKITCYWLSEGNPRNFETFDQNDEELWPFNNKNMDKANAKNEEIICLIDPL